MTRTSKLLLFFLSIFCLQLHRACAQDSLRLRNAIMIFDEGSDVKYDQSGNAVGGGAMLAWLMTAVVQRAGIVVVHPIVWRMFLEYGAKVGNANASYQYAQLFNENEWEMYKAVADQQPTGHEYLYVLVPKLYKQRILKSADVYKKVMVGARSDVLQFSQFFDPKKKITETDFLLGLKLSSLQKIDKPLQEKNYPHFFSKQSEYSKKRELAGKVLGVGLLRNIMGKIFLNNADVKTREVSEGEKQEFEKIRKNLGDIERTLPKKLAVKKIALEQDIKTFQKELAVLKDEKEKKAKEIDIKRKQEVVSQIPQTIKRIEYDLKLRPQKLKPFSLALAEVDFDKNLLLPVWQFFAAGHGGAGSPETNLVNYVKEQLGFWPGRDFIEQAMRLKVLDKKSYTMPHGNKQNWTDNESQEVLSYIVSNMPYVLQPQKPSNADAKLAQLEQYAAQLKQKSNLPFVKHKTKQELMVVFALRGYDSVEKMFGWSSIINLSVKSFKMLTRFFNQSINTHFLYYSTCYGGGDHLQMPFLASGAPQELSYTVVAGALARHETTSITPSVTSMHTTTSGYEKNVLQGKYKFTSRYNFIQFFDQLDKYYDGLGNKTKTDRIDQIASIVRNVSSFYSDKHQTLQDIYNIPQVRLQGTSWARIPVVAPKLGVLDSPTVRSVQRKNGVIDFSAKEAVLLQKYYTPATLKLTGFGVQLVPLLDFKVGYYDILSTIGVQCPMFYIDKVQLTGGVKQFLLWLLGKDKVEQSAPGWQKQAQSALRNESIIVLIETLTGQNDFGAGKFKPGAVTLTSVAFVMNAPFFNEQAHDRVYFTTKGFADDKLNDKVYHYQKIQGQDNLKRTQVGDDKAVSGYNKYFAQLKQSLREYDTDTTSLTQVLAGVKPEHKTQKPVLTKQKIDQLKKKKAKHWELPSASDASDSPVLAMLRLMKLKMMRLLARVKG
ncbi:MAG: hypothetical protein H6679_05825 [Epsilonproteobacteria bacterium]|nr:hypothetical protein [Campylobacterota bacterium]